MTISSRRPRRARPRICSAGSRSAAAGAPGRSKTGMLPYTSAVSTKLMRASIAAPTSWSASWAVGATPKVAVPRQIRDTFTPVEPRTEYFISKLPCLLWDKGRRRPVVGRVSGVVAVDGGLFSWSGVVVGEGAGQLAEGVGLRLQGL